MACNVGHNVYNHPDHLGNIRQNITRENGRLTVLREHNYYPFGLLHRGYNDDKEDLKYDKEQDFIFTVQARAGRYKYRYNGKEWQDDLGLNRYDYGARSYDAAVGRWFVVDPLAEKYYGMTAYNYTMGNPIMFVDLNGMESTGDFFNKHGKYLGTDGKDDGKKYVVTDKKDEKSIKSKTKKGETVQTDQVKSAVLLPSDQALQESLNVLERTQQNGGKREESSIVMIDGTVVTGEPGPEVKYGEDEYANGALPDLPQGYSDSDVEASIHSHPTAVEIIPVDGKDRVFAGNATEPSRIDKTTFSRFKTNIIVGYLGQVTARRDYLNSTTGKREIRIIKPPMGIVIYDKNSDKTIKLSTKAVKRVLER